MVFSCYGKHIATFLNKEGVELFQIGKDKTGSFTFDTLCILFYLYPPCPNCEYPWR
jgi:hypothetical protein